MERGLTRRWVRAAADGSARSVPRAAGTLLDRILAARGLITPDLVDDFCQPRLTRLHDPSLLPGADEAAQRLVAAVRGGRRIVIYGDYDVDGITAAAVLHHVIRCAEPRAAVTCYVPHRLEEGYGINVDALRRLHAEGAGLVVSVDCGITAAEPARVARELGLELIITDHHQPPAPAELPDAAAIVHPGLPGSAYPFDGLCGAGVAFKLAWRFATIWSGSQRVGQALQQRLLEMLPLVALGTIADVVPLLGENRVLASFGLRSLRQSPLIGLRALIEASGLDGEQIDAEKVGFVLAPRLNACGRMGHAADALRLLIGEDRDEAAQIAKHLAQQNRRRQELERSIADEAARMAEESGLTCPSSRAIVLAHEQWHPGVIGIVCSRLVERFGRPVVLLQRQGEVCRGSARSIDGYSIYRGLEHCAPLLERFGGHEHAAGLSLPSANFDRFAAALGEHAAAHITPEQLTAPLPIDCDAELEELDLPAVHGIGRLAPFGRANRRPVLRLRQLTLAEAPRPIGGGRHLSLRLRRGGSAGLGLRAVWWNAAALGSQLAAGMPLDIAIEPKVNRFNGRTSVEAEVRDAMVGGRGIRQ